MKTILLTYLIVQTLTFLGLGYLLTDGKRNGENTFQTIKRNWISDGKLLTYIGFGIGIILTIIVVTIILVGSAIDFLTK